MTYGRIIENIKYMCLHDDNKLKQLSLEDNVYFTLRDIFLNADSADDVLRANDFNHKLTGGTCYGDRDEFFTYTNVLDDVKYLSQLVRWLSYFSIHYFEFEEVEPDEEINMDRYIKFDDWWDEFVKLRNQLEEKLKKYN
jgi:hypothetical protein